MKHGAKALLAVLATAAVAFAAPPTLTAPAEVKGEVSAFVVVKATASGAKWVKYVPLDSGLSVFPSDLLADKTVTVVVASKAGRYRVLAYTGNDEGGAETVTTLVIGATGGGTPPTTDPPVKPPVGDRLHFMIVRPGGVGIRPDLEAEVNRILDLPAWKELKWKGDELHTKADWPFTSLKPPEQEKFKNQPMPFLLTWRYSGNQILLVDGPSKVPTNDAEVRGLLK